VVIGTDCIGSVISSYQEGGEGWEPINRFNPTTVFACPQPGPEFPTSHVLIFFVLRIQVCFVCRLGAEALTTGWIIPSGLIVYQQRYRHTHFEVQFIAIIVGHTVSVR
jgi:hypothetical protein